MHNSLPINLDESSTDRESCDIETVENEAASESVATESSLGLGETSQCNLPHNDFPPFIEEVVPEESHQNSSEDPFTSSDTNSSNTFSLKDQVREAVKHFIKSE